MRADALNDQRLVSFAAHMSGISEQNGALLYSRFDLMEIYPLAPYCLLIEVEQPARQFKIRFVGTEIVNMYGSETTGKYIHELNLGPVKDPLLENCLRLIETRTPQWSRTLIIQDSDEELYISEGKKFAFERLAFALLSDKDEVSHIAALLVRKDSSEVNELFEYRDFIPS